MPLAIDVALAPMEARPVGQLPEGPDWQFEPKWDGFRCLAFREAGAVALRSKSGQPLERYFPDLVAALARPAAAPFVLDGEIVIPVDGALSFEELQLRLHPAASRVAKLAAAHPANFMVFDLLLGPDGVSLLDRPLGERRAALERFFPELAAAPEVQLSPATRSLAEAQAWIGRFGHGIDGLIAKRIAMSYRSGLRDGAVKWKQRRTADCVVGGFRYGTGSALVGSLLLGLYDEAGLLHHVGFTATLPAADKPALTRRLEALVAPPGFTGRAPGGPSRWSTERTGDWQPLRPELVVEVVYDHVTDNRFRHGTRLLRWRTDKPPRACDFAQIEG